MKKKLFLSIGELIITEIEEVEDISYSQSQRDEMIIKMERGIIYFLKINKF